MPVSVARLSVKRPLPFRRAACALFGAVALPVLLAAAPASAHDRGRTSSSIYLAWGPSWSGPDYYERRGHRRGPPHWAPAYGHRAPYRPGVVIVQPAPVYVQPAPVIVTPAAPAQVAAEPYCREYQTAIVVGGKTQPAYGTACLMPDGSWQPKAD